MYKKVLLIIFILIFYIPELSATKPYRNKKDGNDNTEYNIIVTTDMVNCNDTTEKLDWDGSALQCITDQTSGSGLPTVDTTSIAEGSVDNTKEVRFEVDGNTAGVVGILATIFTTAKTITFPDATDTLVGRDTTDTLTNKTIDATNTVTINASDITDLSGSTDITADLEEEAHCAEHDSADVDCSGEQIVYAADSLDFTEIVQNNTLAGNPALLVDECFPVATATGGGLICEGSTADTNEMLFLVPDINEADTTHRLVTESATQTLTNKTIDATNTVTINASDITDLNGNTDITADLEEEGVTCTDCIDLAKLDDDAGTPTAGDLLSVRTGATDVTYTTPNAGTDVTADLEEDSHCSEHDGRSVTCSTEVLDADAELYTDAKCINVDPTSSTTDWFMWKAPLAVTITGVDCIVDAATSVVMTPRECDGNGGTCTDIEAAITCGTTNTTESAGVDNASIDAGDYIRVTRGTTTGSPTQAVLCLEFTFND